MVTVVVRQQYSIEYKECVAATGSRAPYADRRRAMQPQQEDYDPWELSVDFFILIPAMTRR